MGKKPRTPQHWPQMKVRGPSRKALAKSGYYELMRLRDAFKQVEQALSSYFEPLSRLELQLEHEQTTTL